MKQHVSGSKAVFLFVLWWILGFAFVITQYLLWGTEYESIILPLLFAILVGLSVLMPLMLVIHRQAKAGSIKWLMNASKFLLIWMGSILPIFIIILVVNVFFEL